MKVFNWMTFLARQLPSGDSISRKHNNVRYILSYFNLFIYVVGYFEHWSNNLLSCLKSIHAKSQHWQSLQNRLKYQFWKKLLRKNATLSSWTLFQHICPHFWAWLLLYSAITPKSEDKYVVKVLNSSEFHLSEMTLLQNPYFSSPQKTWRNLQSRNNSNSRRLG